MSVRERSLVVAGLLAVLEVLARADVCFAGPIHEAAHSGDLVRLERLAKQDPESVNARDADGYTPLHLSIFGKSDDAAALLIKNGADVNAADPAGDTPLHLAAERGTLEIAKRLLAAGARVNVAAPRDGMTPLHRIAERHSESTAAFMDLLIQHGAEINGETRLGQTPLDLADDDDTAKLICERGGVEHSRRRELVRALVGLYMKLALAIVVPCVLAVLFTRSLVRELKARHSAKAASFSSLRATWNLMSGNRWRIMRDMAVLGLALLLSCLVPVGQFFLIPPIMLSVPISALRSIRSQKYERVSPRVGFPYLRKSLGLYVWELGVCPNNIDFS